LTPNNSIIAEFAELKGLNDAVQFCVVKFSDAKRIRKMENGKWRHKLKDVGRETIECITENCRLLGCDRI
jgi:hypothetical protein